MAVERAKATDIENAVNAVTASLALQFVDALSTPIEGISYEIRYANGGTIGAGTSGGMGLTPIYDNLKADSEILIAVKRDADNKFKVICTEHLVAAHQEITLISPKIKLEAETQKAEGAPGTAHEVQPPPPPKIEDLRNNETNTPPPPVTAAAATYTVQNGDYPGKIAAKFGMTTAQFMALNPQIKDVAKMQIGDVVQVSGTAAPAPSLSANAKPMSSAAPKNPPAITQGRDADGLPMALYVSKARDWLGRYIAVPYNWRTSQDAQRGHQQTQAHPSINPPSTTPTIKGNEQPSDAAMEHLQALVAFEEEQVQYNYGAGTEAVLTKHMSVHSSYKIGSSIFPSGSNDWPAKPPKTPTQRCQVYVNIALAMAGYWNGRNATSSAKDSGKDWLAAGFANVIGELPTVDITMKNKDVVTQADLVYTCPGDVIVYEEYGTKNPGHIDIRTYHGFGSDFVWGPVTRNGFPDQSIYKVMGVYRKYSDTLAAARVQAFLRILREMETRGYVDKDRYYALHDTSGKTKPVFTDESTHPSNAPAGAYQIIKSSYDAAIRAMRWQAKFDREAQDRIAIYLLQGRAESLGYPPRTALGYVMLGDVKKAIENTKLYNEWSSLPGGKQPALKLETIQNNFQQYTNQYAETLN